VEVDTRHAAQLAQLGARERGLRGAAPADHHDLLDRALAQCGERVVRDVGLRQLVGAERQDARDVGGHVPVPDHHGTLRGEVRREVGVVRVAVVPGDELRGGEAPRQVLSRDPERLVRLGPGRVDHGVVVLQQLAVGDVAADLDVAEEAAPAPDGLGVEAVLEALDLLVVGRHPAAQQAPRRRQPLEQVDLRVAAHAQERRGRERAGGSGPDDRDPRAAHAAVRSAVPSSAKNSALRSSA
jgi:hypothetical protein